MSRSSNKPPAPHDDAPRAEPWLALMAAAVLPVAVALFAPQRHHLLLFVASAALFVGGFVLYVVQELRSRRERPSHPKEPPRFLEGDPVDMEGAEP